MNARLAHVEHVIEPLTGAERAIARSVMYASLFDYPLTLAQLRQTLIESSQTPTEIVRHYMGSRDLRRLITFRDDLFYPADRPELPAERRDREARSRRFLASHRTLLTAICALPFVRLVALSGSIAHQNLEGSGDLDLFIVTRGRHVWSTTVVVILLAKLLRRRRTLCANFVLADGRLAIANGDLFTASQIVHLKPLVGDETYARFLEANPFVRRYYPNFHPSLSRHGGYRVPNVPAGVTRLLEWLLAGPAAVAEVVCRTAYRGYLRRRMATWRSPEQVCLDDDCVKLHTQSHRRSILERFEDTVRRTIG